MTIFAAEDRVIAPSFAATSHKSHRHIILRGGSGLKAYRLADYKSHGLGFGFADLFGGESATVTPVQHFVCLCCAQHKAHLC